MLTRLDAEFAAAMLATGLDQGHSFVSALSGGADSTALCLLMARYAAANAKTPDAHSEKIESNLTLRKSYWGIQPQLAKRNEPVLQFSFALGHSFALGQALGLGELEALHGAGASGKLISRETHALHHADEEVGKGIVVLAVEG